MTQRLLIDIGNTRIKWARWARQDRLVLSDHDLFNWRSESIQEGLQSHWSGLVKPDAIHISNVAGDAVAVEINRWCQSHWGLEPTYATVSKEHKGLINSYPATQTLGVDRWMVMIAAWQLKRTNVCIIDCGSAVTIDFVATNGQHLGGLISPGLRLLGKALTDNTHALIVKETDDFSLLADNTEDGINSGCYHWLIGGIEYVIRKMQREYGPELEHQIEYIVTGGDASLVQAALEINVTHIPDLVLQGLMLDAK